MKDSRKRSCVLNERLKASPSECMSHQCLPMRRHEFPSKTVPFLADERPSFGLRRSRQCLGQRCECTSCRKWYRRLQVANDTRRICSFLAIETAASFSPFEVVACPIRARQTGNGPTERVARRSSGGPNRTYRMSAHVRPRAPRRHLAQTDVRRRSHPIRCSGRGMLSCATGSPRHRHRDTLKARQAWQ